MNGFGRLNPFSSRNATQSSTSRSSVFSPNSSVSMLSVPSNSHYIANIIRGNQANPSSLGANFTHPSLLQDTISSGPKSAPNVYTGSAEQRGSLAQSLNAADPGKLAPFRASEFGGPEVTYNSGLTPASNNYSQTGTAVARGVTGAVSTGAAAAGLGPAAIAAQVSQQLGEAVASGYRSAAEASSRADYQHNIQQHGVAVRQNANAIKASQDTRIDRANTGAMIGSIFGPLGALAGHYIGQATAGTPSDTFKVDSFSGKIDPTDRGIVDASSTAGATGETTMTDTV